MIKVILVVTSSRAVLVRLVFAVSLVALRWVICKITWVWKVTAFPARRATTLASVFGVANAALRANVNFSAYSRNNGLRQRF
jgi:DNA-binding transcriptional regulator YdaS (Cro superfamily)